MNAYVWKATFVLMAGLFALMPAESRAQQAASNLDLKKVYLKAVNVSGGYEDIPANETRSIFSPTVINCPGGGSCTLYVTVSAQTIALKTGHLVTAGVYVDQERMEPKGSIEFANIPESVTTDGTGVATTFTWYLTNVAPGTHTVDVRFALTAPAGEGVNVGHRTLRIDVLKP